MGAVSVRGGGSSPSGAAEPRSQGGGTAARTVRVRSTSSRAARRTASGEGTAQPPLTRAPASTGTFFWASKRKCHARRAEKAIQQWRVASAVVGSAGISLRSIPAYVLCHFDRREKSRTSKEIPLRCAHRDDRKKTPFVVCRRPACMLSVISRREAPRNFSLSAEAPRNLHTPSDADFSLRSK